LGIVRDLARFAVGVALVGIVIDSAMRTVDPVQGPDVAAPLSVLGLDRVQ
jgi:hypothetical protein